MGRRKIGLAVMALISMLFSWFYLNREEREVQEELFTKADLEVIEAFKNQTIKLGHSKSQELNLGRSLQDVMKNELSINLKIIPYESDEALEAAAVSGEVDFFISKSDISGLRSTSFPLLNTSFIVTNRNNPLVAMIDLTDRKMGFLKDSPVYREFQHLIGEAYFFSSIDEGLEALENQKIDAFMTRTSWVVDELIPRKDLQIEFILQDNINTFQATTGKEEFYPILEIFHDIANSPRANLFKEKLESSSLQNKKDKIRAYIQETYASIIEQYEVIEVGHHEFSFPYSYFDEEGNSSGIYMEMLNLFQESTDIEYRVRNTLGNTDYNELIDELRNNSLQFLFGIRPIKGIEEIVNLGTPVQDNLVSIVEYGNKDIKSKVLSEIRFGVVDTQEVVEQINFERFEDYESAFHAVLAGEIDVLLGRKSILSYYQNILGHTNLTQVNLVTEKSKHRILGNVNRVGLNTVMEDIQRLHTLLSLEDQTAIEEGKTIHYQGRYLALRNRQKLMAGSIFVIASLVPGFVTFRMKKENKFLRSENERDKLTGLYNREAAEKKCLDLIEKNPNTLGVFFFFDLDDLKFCNDTYGHAVGDQLIIEFAKTLVKFEGDNTVCSRIAGDEYGLFKMGFQSKEEVAQLISEMKQELECKLYINNKVTLPIKVSAGGSIYNSDTTNFSNLKKYADLAMYQAKHEKKKLRRDDREAVTIKLFDIESFRMQSSHVIDTILREKQIYTVYQSVNCITSEDVYGHEGLSRTTNPNIYNIVELIELAESQGRLRELDLLMMETSIRHFRGTGLLFVNMEHKAPELIEEYVDRMIQIVEEVGLPTTRIGIEVSERKQWSQKSIDTLKKLKEKYQFLIAVDDFGVGFANNYLLLNLKPDIVKIDRSLVSNIDEDKDKYEYLKALIEFIKKQNMKIIYEGVEIIEELNALKAIGQDYGQGWYFGKPRRHEQQ